MYKFCALVSYVALVVMMESSASPKMRQQHRQKRDCPCPEAQQCERITTSPEHEIFTFAVSNKNYEKYDWDKVTTLCVFAGAVSHNVTCYAHSKGAKVVFGADYPINKLTDADYRSKWVQKQLQDAKDKFMDGINLDFEGVIAANETENRNGLDLLVKELYQVFKAELPGSQVTFDTPPNPYGQRHYDFPGIAESTDFVVVMGYDMTGPDTAGANSGFRPTATGVYQYYTLDIPPDKMVFGLPWYGYNYPCETLKENKCTVSKDNIGYQDGYDIVDGRFIHEQTSAGLLWDDPSQSPYFNYINSTTGQTHQIWYDNVQSLSLRYSWAVSVNLKGVAMWHADHILNTDTAEGRKQREDMWGALPTYQTASTLL